MLTKKMLIIAVLFHFVLWRNLWIVLKTHVENL